MFLATHGVLRRESAYTPPAFTDIYSFEFDGVSDYFDMGDVLDFDRLDTFSISCWFKRTRSGVSEFLVDKSQSSGNYRGYSILIPSTDDKIYFTLRHTLSNFIQVKSTTAINDSDWHNLVITYSGSSLVSGVNIYIDNVNDTGTSTGTLGGTTITAQPFQIGARNGANNLLGYIDEPAIFDYELTSAQVSTIYGSGVPTGISSLNPVGHWREENATWNGSVWTVTDSGSGGNNGTSSGMTLASRTTDIPT